MIDLNDDRYINLICDGCFMQPVDGKVFVNKSDGSYNRVTFLDYKQVCHYVLVIE